MPTRERLSRLQRETAHVAQLVSDLRFLSLADAGELRLNVQPADAGHVVADTARAFEGLAPLRVA